ncbi:MAG: cytochrome c3 family protein, partial [Bryobacteraceae bacterium]
MGPDRAAKLVAVAAGLLFCCTARAEDFPVPRNAAPGVKYVGSRACASCHRGLYDAYIRTPMGRSMRRGNDPGLLKQVPAAATVHSSKLDRYFEVFQKDSNLYQSEYQRNGDELVFRSAHKLEYGIGSGINGISFVVRRGNHLFQAPLSFYTRSGKWDLSPGYELADHGFSRPIHAACASCHSGRPSAVPEGTGLYRDPPFAELAIGCESCHGPGELHIAEQGKPPRSKSPASIVNPARLPARLAEDICMRCHQAGDTRILQPGKRHSDFRPGTPLSQTLAIFKLAPDPQQQSQPDLLEHHSAMSLSECYRASSGKLSCLTCHNPHDAPKPETVAEYYRAKCLTCHTGQSCTVPQERRAQQTPANDCAGCHMPKRPVEEIAHSALTNHRIVRLPGQPLPERAFDHPDGSPPGLVYLNAPQDTRSASPSNTQPAALTLLSAYGELMTRQPGLREPY